jgi:hypothetical protein
MADVETNSGTWETVNWSKGVPGQNSNVKIEGTVFLDQDESVKSVRVSPSGDLVLTDATLSTKNGVVDNGVINGDGEIKGNITGDGFVQASGGTLEIDGAVDITGDSATTLAAIGSSTLAVDGAVGSNAAFEFVGKSATLNLTGEGLGSNDFHAAVSDFAKGDKIEVAGSGLTDTLSFNATTDVLTVKSGNGTTLEQIQLSGAYSAGDFKLTQTNSDNLDTITTAACFMRGSRLLTDDGYVAIEELRVGDHVVTRSGATRAITWIGHREVDCARHPQPEKVWPICVSRNAFAEGVPSRDLWLSPGHGVFAEGVIVLIETLINERSIVQHSAPSVEYWHVELDEHDIVFAEGLPSESYLDTGNRACFANGGEFIELHPDFSPKNASETCAPLTEKGEEVSRIKANLLARVKASGHTMTSEADLHIVADGRRIEPMKFGEIRFAFVVPEGSKSIALISKTFIPAHMTPGSDDKRSLGICAKRLQIDEEDVPLDDPSLTDDGWSAWQGDHRWTTGVAQIKPNSRLVIVDIASPGFYWDDANVDLLGDKAA